MDYFTAKERERQKSFAAKRDRLFAPLVDRLRRAGISPNQVSLIGIVFLVLACLFPPASYALAGLGIILYVICDGIDGPLARSSGKAHSGGALVDIIADQFGVVMVSAAAIQHLGAWGPVMVLFSAAYMLFIALAVYANELQLKVGLVIRSKYPFYVLYVICLYLRLDWVTYFCGGFALYYFVVSFLALRKIYRHFD